MSTEAWATSPFSQSQYPTLPSGTVHNRSVSEHLQMTSLGVPQHGRRRSVPSNPYALQRIPQSQPAPDYHMESQMLDLLPMVDNRYQQHLTQSMNPSLIAPRPTPPSTIPPTIGGYIPGTSYAPPPHTPWYTPQPSPHPPQQQYAGYPPVSRHR